MEKKDNDGKVRLCVLALAAVAAIVFCERRIAKTDARRKAEEEEAVARENRKRVREDMEWREFLREKAKHERYYPCKDPYTIGGPFNEG